MPLNETFKEKIYTRQSFNKHKTLFKFIIKKILLSNYATFTLVYIYEHYGSNMENVVRITTKIS